MRKYAAYLAAAALVLCLRPGVANAQRRLTIGIVAGQLDTETAQSFEPFTSGYTDDLMAFRRVFPGSVAFVAKPYSPDALLNRVAEVLNAPQCASRAARP
ncbi:MAG: hypothetical protein ABSG41_17045 [Bryobacteraceae bacterium]|jgi:FixJ family two-component response regulator